MLHWTQNRQLDGGLSVRKYKKRGFHHVFEGLKKLTCYPPDHFVFLQSENEDELVPSFAAAFSNINHDILASADEDGIIRFFDTTKTLSNGFVSGFEAHENAIFDIAWAHNEPWIVSASGDQSAVLWDAPSGKKKAVFKQHSGSLKSVSFGFQNNSILATGARDGSILIWDTRCSERARSRPIPISTISKAHEDKDVSRVKPRWRRGMSKAMLNINPLQSVTSVLFQSENILLSSGSADGIVKMWDIRSLPKKQKKTPEPYYGYHYGGNSQGKHGFSSLTLDSSHSRFYANCTDGVVYAYDCVGVPSGQPAATYSGHVNSTFYVKSLLSPDDQYLLSGSSDSNAYIWKTDEPDKPPIILSGHHGEVTAVAWSPIDKTKIVTCADDCTMRIWRMKLDGVKEEELPIGEAKWEEPSSEEDCVTEENSRRSPVTGIEKAPAKTGMESTAVGDSDTNISGASIQPKEPAKGKFNLKAWATPPSKKSTRELEGKETRDGVETEERVNDSESISKQSSPHIDSIEHGVRESVSSPTTPKSSTFCKRRGRRISSLRDWINSTDTEKGSPAKQGHKSDTSINEAESHCGPDVEQETRKAPEKDHIKSDKENKLPTIRNKKNYKVTPVRPTKGGMGKVTTESNVERKDKTKHTKVLSTESSSVSKPNTNLSEMNDSEEEENKGCSCDERDEDKALRDKGNRASSSHDEQQCTSVQDKNGNNTLKIRSSKRRKGDQIFDYFQPLKRKRSDSPPSEV